MPDLPAAPLFEEFEEPEAVGLARSVTAPPSSVAAPVGGAGLPPSHGAPPLQLSRSSEASAAVRSAGEPVRSPGEPGGPPVVHQLARATDVSVLSMLRARSGGSGVDHTMPQRAAQLAPPSLPPTTAASHLDGPQTPPATPAVPRVDHQAAMLSAEDLSRCAIELLNQGPSSEPQTFPTTAGFLTALRQHAEDSELMHAFKYDLSTVVKFLEVVEVGCVGGSVLAMPRLFLEAFGILWMKSCGYVVAVSRGPKQLLLLPNVSRALADHLQLCLTSTKASCSSDHMVSVRIGSCLQLSQPGGILPTDTPLDAWNAAVESWNSDAAAL